MKQIKKRVISWLSSAALIAGCLAGNLPVSASDTLRYEGEAAPGENQPIQHGYRQYDLLSWTPETDMYSESMRARVPLQTRIDSYAPTQANPSLSDKTRFFNLAGDYGNSWFESTTYTNEFSQYLYNFWQYTDYYSYWHGTPTWDYLEYDIYDEVARIHCGTLNIPNPAYTNAAHKNGTLSLACLFVGEASRSGETINTFKMTDENGIPVVAQKIAEMAEYYGFDGVFINDEEMHSSNNAEMQAATRYLIEQGLYVQWYNAAAGISSGSVGNLKDSQGRVNASSWFLDYGWNYSKDSTVAAVKAAGLDPLDTVFFGYEAGGARWSGSVKGTYNDLSSFRNADGDFIASFAMLGTDFVHHGLDEDNGNSNGSNNKRAQDEYQWLTFDRERIWFSGWDMDPTTAGDMAGVASRQYATGKTSSRFQGIAYAVAERSVIGGRVFTTNFSTGHGLQYFTNGRMSNDSEWSNMNMQSILPTWQWWVDVEENASRLAVDFDYGEKYTRKYYNGTDNPVPYRQIGGYNGGNSLVVNGTLDGRNFLRLYKTGLDIAAGSRASIVYNKSSADDGSTMKLGVIFKDGTTDVTEIAIADANKKTEGWQTAVVDLSSYAGRKIAAFGLVFDTEEAISDYQMNIGEITISDGGSYTPAKPAGFQVDKLLSTGEAYVSWEIEPYETVTQYNVYAKMKDDSLVSLGGIYDKSYYIKKLDTANLKELQIKAVGIDGTESEAAAVDCSGTSTIDDLAVTQADAGTLTATFTNGTGAVVKTELVIEYQQAPKTYVQTVDADAGTVSFTIDECDGFYYTLNLRTQDGKPLASVRGKLKDEVCALYEGQPVYLNEEMTSAEIPYPGIRDWKYITISVNNVVKVNRLLKYDNSNKYHNRKTLTGLTYGDTISVVLEDFSGNVSEAVEFVVAEPAYLMNPRKGTLYLGESTQLAVNEKGKPMDASLFTWELTGGYNATTLGANGLLIIGATENAASVTVTATKKDDSNIEVKGSFTIVNPVSLSVPGTIYKGQSLILMPRFKGADADSSDFIWSVMGAAKEGTTVADGVLNVDITETASSLEVIAALKSNPDIQAKATVSSLPDAFKLSLPATNVKTGGTLKASILKFGTAADAAEMNWFVEGAEDGGTTIDADGLLTVSEQETATSLTIRAVYKNEESIILTAKVDVSAALVGCVSIDAPILGVSANGSAAEYKTMALDDDYDTKWCHSGSTGWMAIDLGKVYTIDRWLTVHGEWGDKEPGFNTKAFALEVLKDSNATAEQLKDSTYLSNSDNWTEVDLVDNSTAGAMIVDRKLSAPVAGRYFRLRIDSATINQWTAVRIHEFQLYEVQQTAEYIVSVDDTIVNGSIFVDKDRGAVGEIVTVTIQPQPGYRLVEGSLKANGSVISGDSFIMPAEDVTITAEFEQIPEEDVPITSIVLSDSALNLQKGTGRKLTVTVYPENTTDDQSVTWESSDPSIATVDENGNVQAVSAGKATITATSAANSDVKTACIVTVSESPSIPEEPVVSEEPKQPEPENFDQKDNDSNVRIKANPKVLPENAKLAIRNLTDGSGYDFIQTAINQIGHNFMAYDISIISGSATLQPNGKVSVWLPIPGNYDRSRLAVYRIEEDGTITKMEGKAKFRYYIFETDHFSQYALVETAVTSGNEASSQTASSSNGKAGSEAASGSVVPIPDTGSTTFPIMAVGGTMVILLTGAYTIIKRKNTDTK